MGYVFISYSSRNQSAANAMKRLLDKSNIASWMAPGDIPPGSKYAEVINKAIRECSCLLLLLTNDAQNSIWVGKEVERAVHYRKPILPLQLENVILNDAFEFYISTDQIVAVSRIDENSQDIHRLLNTIKSFTGNTPLSRDVSPVSPMKSSIHTKSNSHASQYLLAERRALAAAMGKKIQATYNALRGLTKQDSVLFTGDADILIRLEQKMWRDIASIGTGNNIFIALKKDGRVANSNGFETGTGKTRSWKNVVALSGSGGHVIGLCKDGSVLATGFNHEGSCNVTNWRSIAAIATGSSVTWGLRENGTVTCTNPDRFETVHMLRDIVAISADSDLCACLRQDGTVEIITDNPMHQYDVSNWTNIVALAASSDHVAGLRVDGTVVAVGENDREQCNVTDWMDVIAISAGYCITVGLRKDGSVLTTNAYYSSCVSSWNLLN